MAVWIYFFPFSSYFYYSKNEQNAFFEKSARSNHLTVVWLRRHRKNTRVQKKNRLKRTSKARVMAVWSFPNSQLPSIFKMLNFQTVVTFHSDVRLTQSIFWILVFSRDLFEKPIRFHWISFLFFHHISARMVKNSKRRFRENRHAQTASWWLGWVDIENIRIIKKKIAPNGRPKLELRPFEFPFSFLTLFILFKEWVKSVFWEMGSLKPP